MGRNLGEAWGEAWRDVQEVMDLPEAPLGNLATCLAEEMRGGLAEVNSEALTIVNREALARGLAEGQMAALTRDSMEALKDGLVGNVAEGLLEGMTGGPAEGLGSQLRSISGHRGTGWPFLSSPLPGSSSGQGEGASLADLPEDRTADLPEDRTADLLEDVLRNILSRVSAALRGFSHALVCRQWEAVAPAAQLSCSVCRTSGEGWPDDSDPSKIENKFMLVLNLGRELFEATASTVPLPKPHCFGRHSLCAPRTPSSLQSQSPSSTSRSRGRGLGSCPGWCRGSLG